MSNKEKILDLYYNQHLKQNEIAKLVGTSTQYVSKVVRADKRNKEEKEKRKTENSENRKVYMQEYFKTYNRPKKDDNSYEQMVAQQRQDSIELSYNPHPLSDYAFKKANSSIYTYDSIKNQFVMLKGIKAGFDAPKRISMNTF